MSEIHDITKEKLNGVGCGFCLAKWTQVTMHLQTGFNHSCHHPSVHKIPLEEIKLNSINLCLFIFHKIVQKDSDTTMCKTLFPY